MISRIAWNASQCSSIRSIVIDHGCLGIAVGANRGERHQMLTFQHVKNFRSERLAHSMCAPCRIAVHDRFICTRGVVRVGA
jgi:hypothetical protein